MTDLTIRHDLRPGDMGRVIALHGVLVTLGGSAGYALGGLIGQQYGWRVTFMFAILPGVLLAALFAMRFREPPRTTESLPSQAGSATSARTRRSYLATITSTPVLLIAFSAALAAFAGTT